jgi:ribose transport system permease protein
MVSLVMMCLFFVVFEPSFRRPSTITLILKESATLAIVAVGLTYVLLCAEIDLAVGYLALWTAMFCGWIFQSWPSIAETLLGHAPAPGEGVPIWGIALSILLPLLTAIALGTASGLVTIWSRLPSFIITLAMMNIALGMSKYLSRGRTLDMPPVLRRLGNDGIDLGRIGAGLEVPYSALLAVLVLIFGHVVLRHLRFGRFVYMTGGNREAARLAGIRTGRIVVYCLAISALTAGLGGLLEAGKLGSVNAAMNVDLLLNAVACVVLGGTSLFGGEGGIGKTVVGVLIFCVLTVGLNRVAWIEDQARTLLTGLVLLSALVINGLLAKRS